MIDRFFWLLCILLYASLLLYFILHSSHAQLLRLLGRLAWFALVPIAFALVSCQFTPPDIAPTATHTIKPFPTYTSTPIALPPVNPLPAPIYLLGDQEQILRLEADGVTLQQITTESNPVTSFDVDPTGAYLVYVSGNNLIRTNPSGEDRQILVEGGPLAELGTPAYFTDNIGALYFAPDGKRLVYGHSGVQLIRDVTAADPVATVETLLSNDPPSDLGPGSRIYRPIARPHPTIWSPDGTKVLLEFTAFAVGGAANLIFDLQSRQSITLTNPFGDWEHERSQQVDLPCHTARIGTTRWNQISDALWIAGDAYHVHGPPGLTEIRAADGTMKSLFYGYGACHGTTTDPPTDIASSLVRDPRQMRIFRGVYQTQSGALRGFVNPSYDSAVPDVFAMQMVQLVPATQQIIPLRSDSHYMGEEILWAPDDQGAVVIVIERHGERLHYDKGRLHWLPSDGGPAIDLGIHGSHLRWGRPK